MLEQVDDKMEVDDSGAPQPQAAPAALSFSEPADNRRVKLAFKFKGAQYSIPFAAGERIREGLFELLQEL